jgi:alkylation response protein AidB-like acyl-CoA dehydrogenase
VSSNDARSIDVATPLGLTPALDGWRREVRDFLADEMADAPAHQDPLDLTGLDETFERAHHRRAGARGYLGISMPAAVGGGGRPPSWKAMYSFEAAYADAPSIDTALVLCGAPLLDFGSPDQHERWLRPMVRGELTGCIAYSEPDAGSDLAALTSVATPDGDGWVLRGHKALVTGAHKADVCLTAARTDPTVPTRRGMSMFVLPLDLPGVEVTRRATMNRWTLSEIVFDGVRLGPDALLGERHRGWSQMLQALGDERSGAAHLGWATRLVEDLHRCAPNDPRVAQLRVELEAGLRLGRRVLALADGAHAEPGVTPLDALPAPAAVANPIVAAAMSKTFVTELLQRIATVGADLEGLDGLRWGTLFDGGSRFAYELVERIHPTISVGANEVQRDTIARFGLGLPVA